MNFIIKGKNIQVTEGMKDRVTKKVGKLEKFFKTEPDVHITFATEKNQHIVDVDISFDGNNIRAEEKDNDMYAAIDKIVDVLEGKIIKYKEKKENHKSDTLRSMPRVRGDKQDFFDSDLNISRVSGYSIKPMTIEDAIMQIKIDKESHLLFVNAQTNNVNMIYTLKDGTYGLVEPEF